jgi:hypothetical protein
MGEGDEIVPPNRGPHELFLPTSWDALDSARSDGNITDEKSNLVRVSYEYLHDS